MDSATPGSTPNPAAPTISSKITHNKPGLGSPLGGQSSAAPAAAPVTAQPRPAGTPTISMSLDEPAPAPVPQPVPQQAAASKISMFGREKKHEDVWQRTPNATGTGAIHVKTFHCKLTEDALMYMDQAINEWLDAHPQYEVKFVNSTIGTMTGKLKEPALFCQVWV
jgi:hypothetical protein